MGLNNTPAAERIHIGLFGRRNAGKSSVINAITGQNLAIVSDVKGTTTDPVWKAMELLPLGPVMVVDTPGLDDEGSLGDLRIQKAYQVLNKTDIAVLVIDGTSGATPEDSAILARIRAKQIPFVVVLNKADKVTDQDGTTRAVRNFLELDKDHLLWISTVTGKNIHELKEHIASLTVSDEPKIPIVGDLIRPMDFIVLVVPIDKAAPKGRLILPQQQTIRDILDHGAVSIVVREEELARTLANLGQKPSLVVTDSQVFAKVSSVTPQDIPLTSFSILFARYKGNLKTLVQGARALDLLKPGDRILISEGCTHHRQCEDIGTVKLPHWIEKHVNGKIEFTFTSGTEFPLDLSEYKMIIHCGGCMLNEREMKYRIRCAEDAGIPITNYGTAIAYMQGILERSIEVFKDVK